MWEIQFTVFSISLFCIYWTVNFFFRTAIPAAVLAIAVDIQNVLYVTLWSWRIVISLLRMSYVLWVENEVRDYIVQNLPLAKAIVFSWRRQQAGRFYRINPTDKYNRAPRAGRLGEVRAAVSSGNEGVWECQRVCVHLPNCRWRRAVVWALLITWRPVVAPPHFLL